MLPKRVSLSHPFVLRHLILRCTLAGIVLLFIFASTVLSAVWYKRQHQHQVLSGYLNQDFQHTLDAVSNRVEPLMDQVGNDCLRAGVELARRAAFADNIQTVLLVKKGHAYCSSATGAFSLAVTSIIPDLHTTRAREIHLQSGTPLQPNKPAMTLWMSKPDDPGSGILTTLSFPLTSWLLKTADSPEISGIAIISGQHALVSWNSGILPVNQLPPDLLTRFSPDDYPVEIALYGATLTAKDYTLIVAGSLLFTLFICSLVWLLITCALQPGKEILRGIRRGEFFVEYQPVIDNKNNNLYGLEALLRWRHPSGETVSPDIFISYAESRQLIIPLTRHLFQLVEKDACQLAKVIPPGIHLGLNLSAAHLTTPCFRQDVLQWLEKMPHDHFNYVFEITERTKITCDTARDIFAWLHAQHIYIAIDDFGTGHSALIYLEKYPFDYLKIDRGFIENIVRETFTTPVLDTILDLGKKLKLKVIVEGVETRQQKEWLVRRGVEYFQGYYFGRPVDVNKIIETFGHTDTTGNRMKPK